MKNKKIFKKILAVMLCMSILTVTVAVEPVQAERAANESATDYINRCYNRITNLTALNPRPRVIALAYLVGEDDMAAASWITDSRGMSVTQDIYAVDPGTQIQGHIYNSEYYPQDNMDYIKDIKDNYENNFSATNRIYSKPKGVQYIEREGAMLKVVACDEEWVTIWDNGYQSWWMEWDNVNVVFTASCIHTVVDSYMETHPAGFYKIQRNKVWLDFAFVENHPYNSEAAIPKAGDGVVTKLTKLRPFPNEDEKTDWESTPVYALPAGTEVNVVSTQLVPSKTSGSTIKYYKVSFNGSKEVQNNGVGYLQYEVPGVYYLDSRYLNVTWKGKTTPADAVLGEIINVKENENVYAYQSRNIGSQQVGILSLGAEIEIFPSESDANWTTVYFSGQKAYVQTKYIKKAPYKVTDISELVVADVVKDEINMSWNAGENNAEYSCSISMTKGKKKEVLWSDEHYKKNSFIIKRKYIEKATALDIEVQATDKNGKKGKKLEDRVFLPSRARKLDKKLIVIGKNKIEGRFSMLGQSLQYSTNKKFKKAVTVENYGKQKGRKGKVYKSIKAIKKLKKNKTYYIRRREKMKIETAAGTKWISGKWSKSIKIKTKKK